MNARLVENDEEAESQRASSKAAESRELNDVQVLRGLDLQRQQDDLKDLSLQIDQRLQHCQSYEQKLTERESQLEAAEAAIAQSG